METKVEYEVVGLFLGGGGFEARYRLGDRELMAFVPWDGVENIDAALQRVAIKVAAMMRRPPPPSEELLKAQIGRRGSIEVS